ncbi:hypothetical protein [Helicobacter ailurogastricus]|uniref:hypothetical protein n=1 Tax=Helicobacter ailurogastricus TaxID=1578720 RepID=UPI0022C76CD8|nr:hypothetical protein [Helicobacter ailurogastricus]GLH57284.1 hypothetical protein NHP214376_00700 [Helicobacter ailurogastricus]GLH59209.1 hypothetical protein NHP214377_04750 [Helicobacter ailurogastricus]
MLRAILTRLTTTKPVTKKGKTEAGTLGQLEVLDTDDKVLFACYTMENAGEPTHESGKDKPIMPGSYTMCWDVTSVCVPEKWRKRSPFGNVGIWLKDPANPEFEKRRIMIHIGNDEKLELSQSICKSKISTLKP